MAISKRWLPRLELIAEISASDINVESGACTEDKMMKLLKNRQVVTCIKNLQRRGKDEDMNRFVKNRHHW